MRILLLLIILGSFGAVSCTKSHPASAAIQDSLYGERASFVIQDNFNFSMYSTGITTTGYADTLAGAGPFTVLAPVNTGWAGTQWSIYFIGYPLGTWSSTFLNDIFNYSILRGRYSFDSLPLGDNQPIPTYGGFHVWVSKYVSGTDTVVTVNGAPLTGVDIPTSNGLIQAVSLLLNPEETHSITDWVKNFPDLTMFAVALTRVGADSLLTKGGPWTVLAPNNTAFVQAAWMGLGISTVDSLLTADTAVLGPLVRGHIIPGSRRFLNDFDRWLAAPGDTVMVTALNGEQVRYFQEQAGWGILPDHFLGGSGQGTPGGIPSANSNQVEDKYRYQADIPSENGVLHVIDQVLQP
ncbi:fasciclin domain-containing protein [Dinghuibacter silviterrae]|uniref:Putative surface protein with fasciclin (FAS1) repeats n=1 Tax=Dinghuibacter silviterrae TaxID=1539049 RepID=A0A4R8DJR0_9BACT|nr:fasciclin domain-containing protein [Dinghuibacter silviterrae]TDW97240.1 putative surface protein with fasciclin (FAS1) repeats [Dinghuibacter silviterrae]